MQGESGVRQRVQQAVLEHEASPVPPLLARLEHEHHRTGQAIAPLAQGARGAGQHGHVGVMAAGVHRAGGLRSEGEAGVFGQRQGVHVAAQEDRAAVGGAAQNGHQAAGRRSFTNFQRQAGQGRLHLGGGPGQIQAQFGLAVDGPAQGDSVGQQRLAGGSPGFAVEGEGVHGVARCTGGGAATLRADARPSPVARLSRRARLWFNSAAMDRPRFHLAFPVRDLAEARAFYGGLLGCPEGRSAADWVDFDFHGHQIVAHLAPHDAASPAAGLVDGLAVPVRHFGVILTLADLAALAERLRAAGAPFLIEPQTRFAGRPGEQATMFLTDPSSNALEFKAFADDAQVFAR